MLLKSFVLLACASCALAHGDHDHDQAPIEGPHKSLWYNTLPGDGGTQVSRISESANAGMSFINTLVTQADSVFSGISTFGRLPYFPCLTSDEEKYDIAFLGGPTHETDVSPQKQDLKS
ncbi:hypothetical protein AYO22_01817 [Fonsecaea multimorphosa]|nr:hypothetical protein AYO22_01817 [Fonsecaea multimorphosa]